MADTASLIERLEKATGPDRELDCLIFAAANEYPVDWHHNDLFVTIPTIGRARLGMIDPGERSRNFHVLWTASALDVLQFTSSIDAAMTLTDPQSHLTIDRYVVSDKPNQMTWRVWIKKLIGDIDGDGPCGLQTTFATGPTIPLALCIAALSCGLY